MQDLIYRSTMKALLITLAACVIAVVGYSQSIQDLHNMQPEEPYDNIYVKKLSSDERSSCFLIWVKEEVLAHKHEKHSECVYVLEGEAEMTINGEVSKVKAGDFIYIPLYAVHAVKVLSETPVKVLSIQAPEFLGKDRVFVEPEK